MEQQLTTWLDANLSLVSPRNPAYDYLDYILGHELEVTKAIQTAIQAFGILVAQLHGRNTPVQPKLAIPLGFDSNVLERAVPRNFSALKERWRHEEPPSLYLVDWDARRLMHLTEEYRCPLPFDLLTPALPGICAYYSEGRPAAAIKSDFEYTKFVIAEYYPEQYR